MLNGLDFYLIELGQDYLRLHRNRVGNVLLLGHIVDDFLLGLNDLVPVPLTVLVLLVLELVLLGVYVRDSPV